MTQPRSTLVSLNATPWHHSGTAPSRRPLRVVSSAGAAALGMAAAACETKPCLYDIPIDSSQEP